MTEAANEPPGFSIADVIEHIETYGLDCFPPLDLRNETVRMEIFFQELQRQWPTLYQTLTLGPEVVVMSALRFDGGSQAVFPSLVINSRGPIFNFPHSVGAVKKAPENMAGIKTDEVFDTALAAFRRTFSTLKILRLGVVRQLVFAMGKTDCAAWLGSQVLQFDEARLEGAQCLLVYNDGTYNYRIQLESSQILAQTPVAATGQVVSTPEQFGLNVRFEVNNREARPLEEHEWQAVAAKAYELWPNGLLEFLNHRRLP